MNVKKMAERIRAVAIGLPETYEESPWGDRVVKVKGKIFLFCGVRDGALNLSVKLPASGAAVLAEKLGTPTAYGLGKSGWVSAKLLPSATVPEERLRSWVLESYRAVAPKRVAAQLDAPPTPQKPIKAIKSPKPTKIKKRVVLLCQDPLRAERAEAALAERGADCKTLQRVADVRAQLSKLDAVILDVGRAASNGLALAEEIENSDHPILLFIVGLRDGAAQKQAEQTASSADLHRGPAGDPEVADAIVATLRRYAGS